MKAAQRFISFVPAMVRATLDGSKTNTRRIFHEAPEAAKKLRINDNGWIETFTGDLTGVPETDDDAWEPIYRDFESGVRCPYTIGETRGIREAAWILCRKIANGTTPTGRPSFRYEPVADGCAVVYCADRDAGWKPLHIYTKAQRRAGLVWRYWPARYLPGKFVRHFITVKAVRVERLQDMTEADARAEGIPACGVNGPGCDCGQVINNFRNLWDSINAERGHGWDVNDWVFVVRIELKEGA